MMEEQNVIFWGVPRRARPEPPAMADVLLNTHTEADLL